MSTKGCCGYGYRSNSQSRTEDAMQLPTANTQEAQDELTDSMTIMYMLIQHALVYPEELHELQLELSTLLFLSKLPHN